MNTLPPSVGGNGPGGINELRWLAEAGQPSEAEPDAAAMQQASARVTALLMLLLTAVLVASAALPDLLSRIFTTAQAAS
jgi:hypothetical protein